MASQWFRVWHDMPNDPKWRTIARASKQPIAVVISVYLHVLTNASNANERGRTHGLNCEDIASALDVETDQVEAILAAMQGRVLEGDWVSGWDKRQPVREDGAAERAKAWRLEQKEKKEREANGANASERTPNAEERPDTDTDTDKEKTHTENPPESGKPDPCPHQAIVDLYHKKLPELAGVRDITEKRKTALRARWRAHERFQDLSWWAAFFETVSESDFLMGRLPGKTWQADFDFLIRSEKFQKIIEGGYQNG
jgi:hypothetical protein